jgi:hypothetical protein
LGEFTGPLAVEDAFGPTERLALFPRAGDAHGDTLADEVAFQFSDGAEGP